MSKLTKILSLCFIFVLIFTSICMATDTAVVISEDAATYEVHTNCDDPTHSHEPIEATNEETGSPQISIMNTDLYLADNDVIIDDVINGNAFIYGNTVTISGYIYGDLFVAGNAITIEEEAIVTGNLFAFGSSITYNGNAGDVYAFAETFTMGNNSYINRDLKLYAAQFHLNGSIQKDVYMAVGTITTPENITNTDDTTSESSNMIVGGNLYYTAQEELTIAEGVVAGNVEFTQITTSTPTIEEIITQYVISFVNVILYALVVILFSIFFTPKFADKVTYCLKKRSFASAGIGILGFILIPIASIFLLITSFLTYVGMALLAMYVLMLSITISVLGIAVGNYLANKLKNKTRGKVILLSLASVSVIWLLQLIPTFGTYISIFTIVFGFGLLLMSIFMRKDVSELEANKTTN